MSDDDLILREDALEAAYVTSSLELARHSQEKIVERIQALPAVTVQAQIDAAVLAALQEVEAKLSSIDMRSCQFEWHPHTAGYIRSEFEKAIALIRKGDRP